MDLTYNKIIKLKLALSGLKNDYLAEKIGINKSTLSRNESKTIYLKVRQFFDKHDIEINEAVDLIIEHFEYEMFDEIQKKLNTDYKFQDIESKIRYLKTQLKLSEQISHILESQIQDKNKLIDKYEFEIEKLNKQLDECNCNKETG